MHKTKGLENPNYLCYRNAVLQCLLHTPEFYRYLDRQDRCATPGDNCVFCALRGLARQYWSNGEDGRHQSARDETRQTARRYRALANLNTAMDAHPVPYAFLRSGSSSVNNMNGSGQQDAHEYFLGLVNMLKYENGDGPHEIR
jgi:ubiquitin C-terminal hydrolase